MLQVLKIAGILLLAVVLFVAYTNMELFIPGANFMVLPPWNMKLLNATCGDSDAAPLCRHLYAWYFWLYALLCGGYAVMAVRRRQFLKPTLLLGLAGVMFYAIQPFTFSELSQPQTYSYEAFIVGFYSWLALVALAFIAALLWPGKRWRICLAAFIGTAAATVFFGYQGRGGVEHINPLVGGLMVKHSWKMAQPSFLLKLCLAMAAIVPACNLLHHLAHWIRHGRVNLRVWGRNGVLLAAFVAFVLLPVLSLPLGFRLNRQDIREAKTYVDALTPKIKAYYTEHKEYPKDLSEVGANFKAVPRLLDIYDYLANGTKGGFYLSRAEKFCVIFPDNSLDPGFWSLTSERPWRFSQPSKALEESFQSVCDEATNDVQQELIAGHLGLPDPDDPYAQFGLILNQVIQPALTEAATPRLQKEIDELGYKDPDIYAKQPMIPPEAQLRPEDLLEELKKQPLRSK